MLILLILCLLLFIFIMNTIFIFIIITVVGTIFMRNRPERTIMSYRCRIDRSKNMCMFYQTWHIRALPCSEHMIKILFNLISESLYHISQWEKSVSNWAFEWNTFCFSRYIFSKRSNSPHICLVVAKATSVFKFRLAKASRSFVFSF